MCLVGLRQGGALTHMMMRPVQAHLTPFPPAFVVARPFALSFFENFAVNSQLQVLRVWGFTALPVLLGAGCAWLCVGAARAWPSCCSRLVSALGRPRGWRLARRVVVLDRVMAGF